MRGVSKWLLCAAGLLAGCSRGGAGQALSEPEDGSPSDAAALVREWGDYTRAGRFRELIGRALPVWRAASEPSGERTRAYAAAYLAQAYLYTDSYDSMTLFLEGASEYARSRGDDFLTAMTSNTAAIYAMKAEMDYARALENFSVALDISRASGDSANTSILLCNIASIYSLRRDTAGLPYAEEAYALGRASGDVYVRIYGAMLAARMSCVAGRCGRALEYALEASELSRLPGQERYRLATLLTLGNVAATQGRTGAAEGYYREALGHAGFSDAGDAIEVYRSYGDLLAREGRGREALEMYSEGLRLSRSTDNIETVHGLLLGLSEASRMTGDTDAALEWYKMYHAHSDSVFNIQKERAFNRLLMRYQQARHRQEMQERELRVARADRRARMTAFVLAVITLVLGSVWVLYRRRVRMYRRLVERHQEFLRRERSLREPSASENRPEPDESLYERLDGLMRGERIYRRKDISLDLLADMLGTNRTYVSRIINQHAGSAFYGYINSLRMEEAVAILSDPADDTPLKALSDRLGYNSLSAFYRAFRNETGVPPSKYRDEVRRMRQGR